MYSIKYGKQYSLWHSSKTDKVNTIQSSNRFVFFSLVKAFC